MIVKENDLPTNDRRYNIQNSASRACHRKISTSTRGISRKIILLLALSSISIPACSHFLKNEEANREVEISEAVKKQVERVIEKKEMEYNETYDKKKLEEQIRIRTEEVLKKMEGEIIACVDTFTAAECIQLMNVLLEKEVNGEKIEIAVTQFRPESQAHVEEIAELLWQCPTLAPRILPTIHKRLKESDKPIRFAIPSSHATLNDEKAVLRICEEFLGRRGKLQKLLTNKN